MSCCTQPKTKGVCVTKSPCTPTSTISSTSGSTSPPGTNGGGGLIDFRVGEGPFTGSDLLPPWGGLQDSNPTPGTPPFVTLPLTHTLVNFNTTANAAFPELSLQLPTGAMLPANWSVTGTLCVDGNVTPVTATILAPGTPTVGAITKASGMGSTTVTAGQFMNVLLTSSPLGFVLPLATIVSFTFRHLSSA